MPLAGVLVGLVVPVIVIAASWQTAMLGITASGWNGVALAEVARVLPDQVGHATAGTVAFTYLGVVVGPASFSGLIAATSGYDLPFYILAGISLLAGIFLLLPTKNY